ncbi:hypothetical protein DSO57_1038776 [Entomophthora muscae]|uniref:Uncharacterized protein n=1 Tax=Entomophthora muscae TaxID=34485 RepID=A0ACC2RPI9_9FUNG|nr:hypothetical protein DSO57_1038776 [Entomophthora muscae]
MSPPHTPRPDCPQDSVATDESTSTQIFGVMYITLTGLIDSMVPTSGPWAILGKLLSYIVKLAPILWWALPSGPAGQPPASSQVPPQVGSLTFLKKLGTMKENYFLFWFLFSLLPVVLSLEGSTRTTDWRNSSPEDSHQEEFLAHGWFKYPSGH